MATYNILIMGASYGSLLASKLLFGGHKIHHVCLPAEADLINAEGFRVRLPVKGRKEPVELDSRKLPGKVTAGGAAGVDPAELRPDRPGDAGAAVSLARRARIAGRGGQVARALHVDHEHAAAALPQAHPRPRTYDAAKPAYTDPTVWDSFDPGSHDAVQPRPAGNPPAGGEGQRAEVTLPTNFKVGPLRRRQAHRHPAPAREARSTPIRFDPGDGSKIELPVKLSVHDSVFVPLAKWAMLLAGNYRCVTKDGMRTAQGSRAQRHRDLARRSTTWWSTCASSSAPTPSDLVPFEKYANAAQSLARPASAARALQNGAPNIERADKLVQLIAKQKGLSHPAIDAQVALVDERLAANRKKAAA